MARRRNSKAPPGTHWCTECQCYHPYAAFTAEPGAPHGLAAKCRKSKKKYMATYRPTISLFKKMLDKYRSSRQRVETKGIPFSLTFEQWSRRQADPCVVCIALGLDCTACAKPEAIRNVDRIDSDPAIGYVWDNTQSLCHRHNQLKNEVMTTEGLLERIKDVPRFRQCQNRPARKNKKRGKARKPIADGEVSQATLAFPTAPKPPVPETLALPFDLALTR